MDMTTGAPGASDPGSGFEQMSVAELTQAVAAMRDMLSSAPGDSPAGSRPPGAERSEPPAETPASAYARGRAEATARIAAILGHAEAESRQAQARVIALESDVTPEVAARMLAVAPKESATSTARAFYEAVAKTGGAPKVASTGEGTLAQGGGDRSAWIARTQARYGRRDPVRPGLPAPR